MSLYLGNNLISGVVTPVQGARNIGQIIQSTIPLTDAGLHLLDGSLISGSGSYADFVDYIGDIYDASANYFCSEADWQASVTAYGVCGKFVYDSVNDTVRLPKLYADERYLIKSYSSGTSWYRIYSDGWCEQGGVCNSHAYNTSNQQVNFIKPYLDTNYEVLAVAGATTQQSWQIAVRVAVKTTTGLDIRGGTNAESAYTGECSWYTAGYIDISDYAVSQQYNYIVIATSTKTQIEVDIDQIATDLNGKADTDLSNAVIASSFSGTLNTAGIRTVVETYVNGESWYRLWSDGWCEQGGGTVTSNGYVYFLKPFRDTNYCLTGSIGYGNTSDTWEHFNMGKDAASYFNQHCCFDGYRLVSWYACGYVS